MTLGALNQRHSFFKPPSISFSLRSGSAGAMSAKPTLSPSPSSAGREPDHPLPSFQVHGGSIAHAKNLTHVRGCGRNTIQHIITRNTFLIQTLCQLWIVTPCLANLPKTVTNACIFPSPSLRCVCYTKTLASHAKKLLPILCLIGPYPQDIQSMISCFSPMLSLRTSAEI